MAGLATIYRSIRELDDPAVDAALAAALPTARGRALKIIALTLLDRHRPEGLLGLILSYHRLGPDARRHLVAHAQDLFRPLREAVATNGDEGPANAIEIIRASLATRLAYLVTDQLRHGSETVKDQAADCLLHLAQRAATAAEPAAAPAIDAQAVEFLQTAIGDAVKAYGQHRHQSVLTALAWLLPRPVAEAMACLDDRRHPASAPMQSALRRADDPGIRRILLPMLASAEQAAAAVDGLRQAVSAGRVGEALPWFHLLALAPGGRALGRVTSPAMLWPEAEQVRAMPPHQRRGLPAYLMALPLSDEDRIARLGRLRDGDDAATRLFALRRLIEIAVPSPDRVPGGDGSPAGDAADDAVAAFCHDADEAIARLALRHLIRRDYPGLSKVLASLVNSRHEQVRRLAGQRLAPLGFARLWETWTRLDTPRRLAAGRALIKIDPNFHRMLGDRLVHPQRKSRVRALAMIWELNQGALFRDTLIQLAQSDDSHVASAAVRALGSASEPEPDPESEPGPRTHEPSGSPLGGAVVQTLEELLSHGDARVRANAIEALAQLRSSRHVDRLVELVDDPESRPRANAIAALMDLRTGDAVHALRRMLDDRRADHRHSALWLIQAVGLLELARHVAEVSVTDPDDRVRRRAADVVAQLLELMESPIPQTLGAAPEPVL